MIECLKMHKENFDYCLGELIRESEEKDKEIERLNKENKELKDGWQEEVYSKNDVLNDWFECKRKINRLHSIIKEVREYPDNAKDNYIINKHQYVNFDNIREILDKENE